MKNILKLVVTLFLMTLAIPSFAATGNKISGYIFDKATNQPIPDANVLILNTQLGAASRDGGFYFIENIPPGKYDIAVQVIGYETQVKKQVLVAGNMVVNFSLNPAAIEFDPIIVTATLSDHRLSQVAAASEVLTKTRLLARTGSTVGELLVSAGGTYANSYDGIAGTRIASIRGSNADQVVVLLDGLRLNTAQGGGVDLNLIPAQVIEKIEIVRGGHSALLGSDAIGGAIQLFSKDPTALKHPSLNLNTTLGSFGTRTLALGASQRIGRLGYLLNYHRIQSNGDFTYKNPGNATLQTRQNNDYQGDNLFLKTNYAFNPGNRIAVLFHSLTAKKGNAGSVNLNPWTGQPMLTPNARAEVSRQLFAFKSENQLTDHLRLEGQTFYQTYNYHYTDPDGWAPTDDKHENSAIGLNLQAHLNLSDHFNLVAGTEVRQDRLHSTKFKVDDRNIQSLYFQSEIRFPVSLWGMTTRWATIPALRWDNYSDVNSQLSPKIGWLISAGNETSLSLRANIGTSYRVPTFDDLYWPDEGWGRGNPDLKPETSTGFDFGVVLKRETCSLIQAEVNYFHNQIDELISWGADQAGIWMPLNIGRAKISGVEAGLKLQLPQDLAFVEIFHTWMQAIDETPDSPTNGKRLIYRPDNKLNILLGSNWRRFSVDLNYRWVGKRQTLPDNSDSLPAYSILNGKIRYSLPIAGVALNAGMEVLNLLDESIFVYDGYPLPGREVRFSLGVNY